MLDYIIVGLGLSGISMAKRIEDRGLEFQVFDPGLENSSMISGGVFNPVILKRFSLAWKGDEQMDMAMPFYRELEGKLGLKLMHPLNIFRKFHSAEEQNNWFSASDKERLRPFLDTQIFHELNPHIPAPHGFGRLRRTGMIDTAKLLKHYRKHLQDSGRISTGIFDYQSLELKRTWVEYKGMKAKRLIFCEGAGLGKNPFFSYLPLSPNKGEYLIITSEALDLKVTVKSSVFIAPRGNGLYTVGATYRHKFGDTRPTEEAREFLTGKLEGVITCDYRIVDQVSGIRPATLDRKPLVGKHPEYASLFCCNGFGSRGVLNAPMASASLMAYIEEGEAIDEEMDVARFRDSYGRNH